jgi:hypothetical protein
MPIMINQDDRKKSKEVLLPDLQNDKEQQYSHSPL